MVRALHDYMAGIYFDKKKMFILKMNGHTASNSSERSKPLAYAHNQIYSINYCQYANYVNHSP